MTIFENFDKLNGRMVELKDKYESVVLDREDLAAFRKVWDALYSGELELTGHDVYRFLKVRNTLLLQVVAILRCPPGPGPVPDGDGGGSGGSRFAALGE
jgi:hypothetical protein